MSQINASSAKKAALLYFSAPKTSYEKYVNKKWEERVDIFISKQNFIKQAVSDWNKSTQEERDLFMSAPPPAHRAYKRMDQFFKSKSFARQGESSTASTSVSTTTTTSGSATVPASGSITDPASRTESSEAKIKDATSNKPSELTENAHSALTNCEAFLNSKENCLLQKMFKSLGCAEEEFFTDDIKNDESLISVLKSLAYSWDEFHILKASYQEGQKKPRKSSFVLSSLQKIEGKANQITGYIRDIAKIGAFVDKTMPAMVISQTYLGKAELITKLIALAAQLVIDLNDAS